MQVKKAATDQTVYFHLRASADGTSKTGLVYNSAGAIASYVRTRGTRTAISLATLAAANSAHSNGGFKEIDGTNAKGLYRFDVPDAAFASGVDEVIIHIGFTDAFEESLAVELVDERPGNLKDDAVTAAKIAADAIGASEFAQAAADKVRASACVTGDPANSVGKILYEIYTNRVTSTRAGYLDNLSAGAVALASGVDLTKIHGVALTETVNGYLAAAFTKLFDVATPLLVASEVMRGTDSAALAASYTATRAGYLDNINNANLATIADISTLTATEIAYLNASVSSRSSHTAANVWAVGTRALTDKADFALSSAAITAIFNKNISAYSGAGYAGTYLKNLYDNQGDWLTATGFSTHNAAAIWSAGSRALSTPADYKADVSALALEATLTDIKGTGFAKDTHSLPQCLTATGFSTHNAADIWSVGTRALTDKAGFALSAASRAAIADDVWDEVLTGATHNNATSAGRRLRQLTDNVVRDETAQAGSTNTITLDSGASATDNWYDPAIILIYDGTGAGQSRRILDYKGSTKVATVNQDWRTNPDETSKFIIFSDGGLEYDNEGAATGGAGTSITLNSKAVAVDDTYKNQVISTVSGTGKGQCRIITAYNGTTKVATVHRAWETNPGAGTGYFVSACVDISALALEATLTAMKGTTFNGATDSLEALRDRGDAAWITAAGFATQNPPSQVLADYKATGFSTHSAADVWAVATRALTDKAGFVLSAAGITAIFNKNISAFSGAGYAGTYLKTLYNDWLNGGRLDLLLDAIPTTAMRGTDDAALEATLTAMKGAGFLTGTDSLEAIRNRGDSAWITGSGGSAADIADAVWDELQSQHADAGSFGKYLDAAISGVSAIGSGALSCTWTQKDDDENSMDNVAIWICTDEEGVNVVAGTIHTNSSGEATFMLDAGTYYVWREKAGENFTNPQTWSVS